ncbi:hypothetical protein EG68_08650 [Paragonimus skrjabini miyazakii]|uniref:5'-nucleotidase domain-containing protein 3 n=1 Tax=Paragonimus skrjabini miyazakii TaxID=59628 RepID=A0A8S9YAF2_9TREM|nr:hypothetical protein EG68_08650 [Paragonimus skrjabini miyazakii]
MLKSLCVLMRISARIRACSRPSTSVYVTRRFLASTQQDEHQRMQGDYAYMCKRCEDRAREMEHTDPYGVFVNNEVKLGKLHIFGFDYDHTLATYTPALDEFIFNEARDWMVRQMRYPDDLLDMNYAADFAIRGLHFDAKRGYLMKVDAFHNIQLDTVHRGLTPVSYEESLAAFHGNHLPSTSLKQQISPGSGSSASSPSKRPLMFQLMDFFTIPEFYLLCSIIEFFERGHIGYQPVHIFRDVSSAVARVHKSGLLGLNIMANPEKYIRRDPDLPIFLRKLAANGRKLFLISNSSAAFIDRGLRFLIGSDWKDLFDVTISGANKPGFFQHDSNSFRHVDDCGTFKDWEGVKSLHRGHIYEGGSLQELIKLTQWNAENILYFGDHVYSDLADAANLEGWTTAAVIPELEHEIQVNNTTEFRTCSAKLRYLEGLINSYQHVTSLEAKRLLEHWQAERKELRYKTKVSFNKHFGSIFRSFHNPSYFSRRLTQYAMLYTSKVANLLQYPLEHVFYPKRTALPHESSW